MQHKLSCVKKNNNRLMIMIIIMINIIFGAILKMN